MNDGIPTLLLLHGAGTGPWVWDRVLETLQTPAIAPTYPGRVSGATPDACADGVVAALDRAGIDHVVPVLHSLAGVLARPLAERLGSRLKKLILLSAVVPAPYRTFAQTMGFPARLLLPLLFRFNPNGLKPSPKMIRAELCHDLTEEDTDSVIENYAAEMPGLYMTPAGPGEIRVPATTYLKLLQDRSVPPSLQDSIAGRLTGSKIREFNAGHLAMLSRSRELAHVLDEETGEINGADS